MKQTNPELLLFVQVGGRVRNFDPVSNNDFWWYKEKKNTVDN